MAIRAIKQTYRGVLFASTLEADWAKTLDSWKIPWSYEPEGVRLPDGENYRPDLFLPSLNTWVEVKGPHNQRINKPDLLAQACLHAPGCDVGEPVARLQTSRERECSCGFGVDFPYQLVVVARPNSAGKAVWEPPHHFGSQRIVLLQCPVCNQLGFTDAHGLGSCRRCHQEAAGGKAWGSGLLRFEHLTSSRF